MSFTNFMIKLSTILCVSIVFTAFVSCGSFQYAGTYNDGIYNDSNNTYEDEVESSNNSSEYYKIISRKSLLILVIAVPLLLILNLTKVNTLMKILIPITLLVGVKTTLRT